MFGINLNKDIIMLLGILGIAGYIYYLDYRVDSQKIVINDLTQSLQSEQAKLKKINADITEIQNTAKSINTAFNDIDTNLDKKVKSLESKIGRNSIIVKKPELIETKINNSYKEFANRFDCEIGAKKCG